MAAHSSTGNTLKYTVIYSYECPCHVRNGGSLTPIVAKAADALKSARETPIYCSSCGLRARAEDLRLDLQFLAF